MAKEKPKYGPLDRVNTPQGPGMVLRQVTNLFLMRPGNRYEVELSDGTKAEFSESELTP